MAGLLTTCTQSTSLTTIIFRTFWIFPLTILFNLEIRETCQVIINHGLTSLHQLRSNCVKFLYVSFHLLQQNVDDESKREKTLLSFLREPNRVQALKRKLSNVNSTFHRSKKKWNEVPITFWNVFFSSHLTWNYASRRNFNRQCPRMPFYPSSRIFWLYVGIKWQFCKGGHMHLFIYKMGFLVSRWWSVL